MKGPTIRTIPATTSITCSGCEYHKHNLVKSGSNPIYRDDCVHESAPVYEKFMMSGNLHTDINRNIHPGLWCPFMQIK